MLCVSRGSGVVQRFLPCAFGFRPSVLATAPARDHPIGLTGGASLRGLSAKAFQRTQEMLGHIEPASVMRMLERRENGTVERLAWLSHRSAFLHRSHRAASCRWKVKGQA